MRINLFKFWLMGKLGFRARERYMGSSAQQAFLFIFFGAVCGRVDVARGVRNKINSMKFYGRI